jgi:muramoyltetrapeptide carboxypeptidase
VESSGSLALKTDGLKTLAGVDFLYQPPRHVTEMNGISYKDVLDSKAAELYMALTESCSDAILCARGGYGASDLLSLIPWNSLKARPPKLIIGFSDITALHCAVFTQLGWPSLHGPMPMTDYWTSEEGEDVRRLFEIITSSASSTPPTASIELKQKAPHIVSGTLFGGCLSVLTNLIGTPFFPATLKGKVIFLEDIGESLPKINRMLSQWILSGLLEGAEAVVLGSFKCLENQRWLEIQDEVLKRFTERLPGIPIFSSEKFGHKSPNWPLIVGSFATIKDNMMMMTITGNPENVLMT